MFEKEQEVFYPKYGIGKILAVESMKDGQESYLSYVVEFAASREKVSLPVSEALKLGLRALSSPKIIEESLVILASDHSIDIEESWKDRKKELEILFSKGDLKSLAYLVRILFERHQFRPLGNRERQLYDFSYDFLVNEIATTTHDNTANVEHEIAKCILNSLSR